MLERVKNRVRGRGSDEGATLIVVVIVMLVLFAGAVAVAALTTNTLRVQLSTKQNAQSRAAADAGLSEAVVTMRTLVATPGATVAEVCNHATIEASATDVSSGLDYDVRVQCDNPSDPREVVLTAEGRAAPDARTVSEAVYELKVTSATAGSFDGAELVSFVSSGAISSNVTMTPSSENAQLVFPNATSMTCQSQLYGFIRTKGSMTMNARCFLTGGLYAGGDVLLQGHKNKPAEAARITQNSEGAGGTLSAVGTVEFAASTTYIDGALTVPAGETLRINGSTVAPSVTTHNQVKGGISRPGAVDPPSLLTWYKFVYNPATDWVGYHYVDLSAAGATNDSGYTCETAASDATFWTTYLSSLPSETILDARKCAGGFNAGEGGKKKATLSHNVVFLANSIDLSSMDIDSADKVNVARAWFVVEDTSGPGLQYDCSDGKGQIDNKAQGSKITVIALAYTPCEAIIANGAGAIWTGSIYAKTWTPLGTMLLDLKSIGLPGIRDWQGTPATTGGTIEWGDLVSRRDVP